MKYVVQKHEIGLLFKKGVYVKTLTTGIYKYSSMFNCSVKILDKRERFENSGLDIRLFKDDKNLIAMLDIITVKDNEAVFHFTDSVFTDVLFSGAYSYFKDICRHEFIVCDISKIDIPETIDRSIFNSANFNKTAKGLVNSFSVNSGCEGALYDNGKFVKLLPEGKYWYFVKNNTVEMKQIDLKMRTFTISGQELLTMDKVALRINFAVTVKTKDCMKAVSVFGNYDEQLYLLFQLSLREYISSKTLDELLAQKHEIGKIILETLKKKEKEYGAEFTEAGIKDIILPGEIKEILNTVLIAEKKALANVITRREETASTRSLLNTAKLMDENATLLRLKELEYLEKICDKVGTISLSNNGGIIDQLTQLIKKQ